MVDIVMIRTFEQAKIEAFAAHSRVPVVNGLTNEFHPCQILADLFTFIARRDRRLAVRGLGRSGKPDACVEGADGVPAALLGRIG